MRYGQELRFKLGGGWELLTRIRIMKDKMEMFGGGKKVETSGSWRVRQKERLWGELGN